MTPVPHSRPWVTAEDRAAVDAALQSGALATGERVARFEAALGGIGAPPGVATDGGTAALRLALHALGVGPGDEVVLPTYVCFSVASAVQSLGARPVPADVGEDWLMGPVEAAARLTPRTRAVVAVDVFGLRSPVEALAALGPPVIVDACQALVPGAPWAGAAARVYSFHATKCLTTGEGGLVASPDAGLLDRARAARDAGKGGRLSDLAAALGLSQLGRYPDFLARRRALAERLLVAMPAALTARFVAAPRGECVFRFPLSAPGLAARTPVRGDLHGVCLRPGVDALVHRALGLPDVAFPRACARFADTVSVPLHPSLSDDELDRVIEVARALR